MYTTTSKLLLVFPWRCSTHYRMLRIILPFKQVRKPKISKPVTRLFLKLSGTASTFEKNILLFQRRFLMWKKWSNYLFSGFIFFFFQRKMVHWFKCSYLKWLWVYFCSHSVWYKSKILSQKSNGNQHRPPAGYLWGGRSYSTILVRLTNYNLQTKGYAGLHIQWRWDRENQQEWRDVWTKELRTENIRLERS